MGRMSKQLDPAQTGFKAEKLEGDLRKRIVGQNEAIQQIVSTYQTFLAGMSASGGRLAAFFFRGRRIRERPEWSRRLPKASRAISRAVIKIDCAEFQHSHEIAKLIGAPPGYLGHRETHALLSQDVH